MGADVEVAIVGAGPYGLAAAAHLRARGVDLIVFGRPLEFWRTQTPRGMLLRSPYLGSSIGDPDGKLTLAEYERLCGARVDRPIPVQTFVDYGCWFQQRAVPDLDTRTVDRVEHRGGRWQVRAGDDDISAARVVLAAGVGTFAHLPDVLGGLDDGLVSHTLQHDDLAPFAGQRVAVVGGGQSALESAALLNELGAEVTVLVRQPAVRWLAESARRHRTRLLSSLLYAKPDVGPALVSQLVARPHLYARLPRRTHERLAVRSVRPAGAGWLRPRLASIPIRLGTQIREARMAHDGIDLGLSDGSRLHVDHVLAGTGYRVDLAKYAFLAGDVCGAVACDGGYPVLSPAFETTVPGLHVIGAPAARRYGPLMRFVAGSDFAGTALARGIRP